MSAKLEIPMTYVLSVAVKKVIDGRNTIVGHVPRCISPLCSVFIRRGGSIMCIVDIPRQHSVLDFNKMKKLVQFAMEKRARVQLQMLLLPLSQCNGL